jgi:hypothetical protein
MKATISESYLVQIGRIDSELFSTLRSLEKSSSLIVRNLVLDYYSSQRVFIRRFQKEIDSRLDNPIAKSWDCAINADYELAFKNMATQVIEHFDDQWTTSNRLIATRVMQCIGRWKEMPTDPAWEARVKEYINLSLEFKEEINRSPEVNNSNKSNQVLTAPHGATTSKRSSPSANSYRSKGIPHQPPSQAKSTSNNGTGPLLAAVLAIGVIVSAISQIGENQDTSQSATSSTSDNIQASKTLEQLQTRLVTYNTELANARIVCELENVSGRFATLVTDAKQLNSLQLAQAAEQGMSTARNRIQRIKQPGKQAYWESCDIGVGFQPYDQYSWEYGKDFRMSFFAVAKKDCINPAIGLSVYADKALTKKLHSQWVTFSPNAESGIADKISFSVPARDLPKEENSYIWWNHEVKCNYPG